MAKKELATGTTLLEDLDTGGTPVETTPAPAPAREANTAAEPEIPVHMPKMVLCEGTAYVLFPGGTYRNAQGQALDLDSEAGAAAYFAAVMDARGPGPATEKEEPEPQDVHSIPSAQMSSAIVQGGMRWCPIDELSPGPAGNLGVQLGHQVVVRSGDESMGFVVTHLVEAGADEGTIVSLSEGKPDDVDTITVPLRGRIREWVMARVDAGQTPEQYVARIIGDAWLTDPTRTLVERTTGMSGRAPT